MATEPESLEAAMDLYLSGSVSAFEWIYAQTAPRVRAWLRRKLGDPERAEEVLQNTYLKFHRSRHQYRAGEVLEAWLFSIVRSTWIDYVRKEKRRPDLSKKVSLEDAPLEALVSQVDVTGAEDEGLARVTPLEALPEGHREAIELRYALGETFESMARKWNVSEASARQRVSRAVRALRILASGVSVKEEGESK